MGGQCGGIADYEWEMNMTAWKNGERGRCMYAREL